MIDLTLEFSNGYCTTRGYYATWRTMVYFNGQSLIVPGKVKKSRFIKGAWRKDYDHATRQLVYVGSNYNPPILKHGTFVDTETNEELIVSPAALSAIMYIWRIK